MARRSQRTATHETICNCIYAKPRGELRKDQIACLRRAQANRTHRSRVENRRGQLPAVLSIHVRPIKVNGRESPGHWEGDFIKGAGNRSAEGVLVERSSLLVMLAKMADATAASALEGLTAKLLSIAKPMRQTPTVNTGTRVYLCDRHGPGQRGSRDNINGLIRRHLPMSTDLSVYS